MSKQILIVEDDTEINTLLTNHLQQEGFIVFTAFDGEEAKTVFSNKEIDLILLDLMLPKLNGMEFLKIVREKSLVPVLIISAKASDLDKALGLGFGADDYIAKPFSLIEVTARVHAAIRRATQYLPSEKETIEKNIYRYKDISMDLADFSVWKRNEIISLTSKEFHILKLFLQSPNRVFTKEQIYNLIWEDTYYGDESVINVHIGRLRKKIEDDPSNPNYIKTIWGIGYKLGG